MRGCALLAFLVAALVGCGDEDGVAAVCGDWCARREACGLLTDPPADLCQESCKTSIDYCAERSCGAEQRAWLACQALLECERLERGMDYCPEESAALSDCL